MNNPTRSSALSSKNLKTQSSVPEPHDLECQAAVLNHLNFDKVCTELLKLGYCVRFRAPGKSMHPSILDGDVLIVEPIDPPAVQIGDIILYRADEGMIAHRVIDIEKAGSQNFRSASLPDPGSVPNSERKQVPFLHYSFILRGDDSLSNDEPVYANQILGKIVSVERHHRSINPYSLRHKLVCRVRVWACRLKRLHI